ncbi:MAG: TolC family outer membrane protein [Gammaproteobacteria bacterium]|jgi:adhesin transport system outer membrane protein
MGTQQKLMAAVLAGLTAFAPVAGATTLQEAVRQALNTNPEVQASRNERLARGQELRQARAGYYPSVDLTAGIGQENTDSPFTRAAGETGYRSLTRREAELTARENLFAGFATVNESKRQKARVNAADFTVMDTSQRVALSSIRAYLDVLRSEEQVRLAKAYLAAHQRTYDQVRRRSESGLARTADFEQVQGRLALARTTLINAQRDLADARSNYMRVVGEMPRDPMAVPATVAANMPAGLSTAEAMALKDHPTLQAAEADVAAAKAQMKAAGNTFYPHIDAVASQSWGRDLNGLKGLDQRQSLMLEGNYNLFNGGADSARYKEYQYRLKQAEDVRDNTRRQVLEGVRLSWSAYEATTSQLQYLKAHEDASRQARDAYIKQWRVGRRTLLDVLDTEKEFYEASKAYTNARYDRVYAQYRVLAGMGALLGDMGISRAQQTTPDDKG